MHLLLYSCGLTITVMLSIINGEFLHDEMQDFRQPNSLKH